MDANELEVLRLAKNMAEARHESALDLVLLLTSDGHLSPVACKAANAACQDLKVKAANASKTYWSAYDEVHGTSPKAAAPALVAQA